MIAARSGLSIALPTRITTRYSKGVSPRFSSFGLTAPSTSRHLTNQQHQKSSQLNLFTRYVGTATATNQTSSPPQDKSLSWISRFLDRVQRDSIYTSSTTLNKTEQGKPLNGSPKDQFSNSTKNSSLKATNPIDIVEPDLHQLKKNIVKLLNHTQHPLLKTIASYYVELEGKRFRPTIVLLLSRALESHKAKKDLEDVLPKQLQLAEIIEMIHTASIVHDDVIDLATTRRGLPSINVEFGNKLAILSGDYLLARASVSLSYLENHEVTRLISTVISDLVEGELMQIKPTPSDKRTGFDYYLQKTYFKTASLIANGCRSAAILSGCSSDLVEVATDYGTNLGVAFQLIDDLLDFTESSSTLGKPAAVDLSLGLATAPVLFAREEFPELSILIERKFEEAGDVEKARNFVSKSKGLVRTRDLATQYIEKAIDSLNVLSPSQAKEALIELAHTVLSRNK